MLSLSHVPPPVHASRPGLAIFDPIADDDDDQPYCPTPAEEAMWMGFTLALDGERPWLPRERRWDRDLSFALIVGAGQGKLARELREAYELGKALGLETEISEPPAGLSPAEAAEYRRGFAAGQAEAEAEDDRQLDAWIAEREAEQADLSFADRITDADMYPIGCTS